MMDSVVAWHPSLADEARSGSSRPLEVTPAARRARRAHAGFQFAVQPGGRAVDLNQVPPIRFLAPIPPIKFLAPTPPRFLSGSPGCRSFPRRNAGLPGSWAVLFLRAKVVHPAGCSLPSPTLSGPDSIAACSYDECFSDADCPANTPCECRDSASSAAANRCLSGSDCRVDSDCGPGNFCSPSQFGQWCGFRYYCHTASDTCLDDSDCVGAGCNFGEHWACGGDCPFGFL